MDSQKAYRTYLFYALLLLVLLPKINIIQISGMAQGVRVDDFIVLTFIILFGFHLSAARELWIFFVYVATVTFFGILNNSNEYNFLRIISLVRIIEYLVVYSVSKYLLDLLTVVRIVKFVYWTQFAVMLFQFVSDYSEGIRASGTTAGPWEGALLACLCYLIWCRSCSHSARANLLYSLALAAMLIMTAARAQLVSMGLILIIYLSSFASRTFRAVLLILFTTISFYAISLVDFEYINFSRAYYYIYDNYRDILLYVLDPNLEFDRDLSSYDTGTYDASLISRIGQWVYYLKSIGDADLQVYALLFGSGPNSSGINLDGWYIKVFVDFGLVGLIVYLVWLLKILLSHTYTHIGILILVSGLTLDLFWASKFTYLLLIAWGAIGIKGEDFSRR